ncbi:FAST kinase domain-containing protein 4 isoform X2 [Colius striatus]|uniref:FAST kinase domain-containing protein 4 isoform X2 n=1 Tax=Colius striatus TaxID=57412 RepID=UPI002B1D34B0|nr:FAST kinase domain-containing protein 4 isoform X2 [Colius striatus]
MAAHLVRRCCWRHLGAFLCPSSAIPASLLAGKLATTRRALPHPPLSSFHTSSPWRWADGFSVKEQVEESGNAEYKVIEELIETASTPHELLQLSELHSLNSNQASLIITQLSRLTAEKKLEAGSILQDGRFQQLISITDSQISQVWNNTLVNLLKSLYCLGLDSSSREMQSVEQEVLWRLRRLSFRQLSSLAEFLAPRESKDSKLLSELIKKLELRWTELEGTRSVVAMMGKVGHISPALMDRLEDKALELAEQFSPDDVRKITLALAYQNRRCVPLLRALSYHLVQKHSELSLSVLMDLIFAYGKLNFHQPQVFQKIATELQPLVPSMTPLELTRCTRSLALLKWLSLPLFEAVAQYALDKTKQLSVTHLCGIILSFARLNFQPSNSEDFFSMVHEELQGQLARLEPPLLTELVWSLCVLQQAKAPYLQQVLAPDFHAGIRDAEVVVNGENKPLPVKDFAAPHLLCSEGTKPLPPGARRVAFLRWEFPNFSNRSKELLGRFAMARRHLQAAGFLVVDVPHYEFLELKLERQRVSYLRDKLHKAVAKELVNSPH